MLLVEQNVPAALAAAERRYVLHTGRIVAEGTSRPLFDSDLVPRLTSACSALLGSRFAHPKHYWYRGCTSKAGRVTARTTGADRVHHRIDGFFQLGSGRAKSRASARSSSGHTASWAMESSESGSMLGAGKSGNRSCARRACLECAEGPPDADDDPVVADSPMGGAILLSAEPAKRDVLGTSPRPARPEPLTRPRSLAIVK